MYLLHFQEHVLTKLPPTTEKCVDHDPRIVDAYANQFQAEAQEGATQCGVYILDSVCVCVHMCVCMRVLLSTDHHPMQYCV